MNDNQERKVQVWSEDSSLALQGCIDCTDRSVFQDASESIDELTEVVCDYVSFCTDMIIPNKTVRDFPNNKPRCLVTQKSFCTVNK